MNLAGADRILRAVGSESYPADIDRAALVRGPFLCAEWYREALRYGTARAEKEHLARLAQISKTAKRLTLLLQEDDRQKLYDWESLILRLAGRGDDVLRVLGRLVAKAERDLADRGPNGPLAAYLVSFQKRSAFEWLVGYWLPMVYVQMDFVDPGSKEVLLAKDSAFIRFVSVSLAELDVRKAGRPNFQSPRSSDSSHQRAVARGQEPSCEWRELRS